MSSLQQTDRERLVKLLNLLSSDHVGECAAAGAAAHRFLKQRGLSWEDALSPRPVERLSPEIRTWRSTCQKLLERPRELSPWEKRFVADLPRFGRISTKQRHWLNEIALRVLGSGI